MSQHMNRDKHMNRIKHMNRTKHINIYNPAHEYSKHRNITPAWKCPHLTTDNLYQFIWCVAQNLLVLRYKMIKIHTKKHSIPEYIYTKYVFRSQLKYFYMKVNWSIFIWKEQTNWLIQSVTGLNISWMSNRKVSR